MLTCLRVRDLAIVAALEIELHPGLNVITGETGAGKSLLVDALELLAGARARGELVRAGAPEASVEASFDLSALPHTRERLVELLGEEPEELILRRQVKVEGRSRAFINGTMATAVQLTELAPGLVDICSQHEHHTLVDPSTHVAYLDEFGQLHGPRAEVQRAWERFRAAADRLDAAAKRARDRVEREALIRVQLEELRAIDPQPDELEELDAEHGRLAHADRLAGGARQAEDALYARDGSLSDQLARICHGLEALRGLDAELDPLIEQADTVRAEMEELGRDLGRYARSVVHDPERLRQVDERIAALRRLMRRYGGTLDALIAHKEKLEAELSGYAHIEEEVDALEAEREAAGELLVTGARALSTARHAAARRLGEAITSELRDLGMGDARVEVDVARLDGRSSGGVELGGLRYTAAGMDRVELLIAPNRGEPPRPLVRIASGGELSRSLLAIKRVLAADGPAGLYVFDEVDSGVGGAVAEVIGQKLAEVARHRQVLCITHLPQIAAYADRHMHIRKRSDGDRTRSEAITLDDDARIEELARMMGGIELTGSTRQAAAELIAQAARHRAR